MRKTASGFSPVIAVDRKATKPLHKQIYDAYRDMIVGQSLDAGQQIPSWLACLTLRSPQDKKRATAH